MKQYKKNVTNMTRKPTGYKREAPPTDSYSTYRVEEETYCPFCNRLLKSTVYTKRKRKKIVFK